MRIPAAASAVALAALFSLAARAQAPDPTPPEPAQPAPPLIHIDAPPPAKVLVEPGAALVFIGDDGGLTYPGVRAIRGLAIGELRKRGVPVVDDPRADAIVNAAQAEQLMRELNVSRGFSVRVQGRLGNKLPLSVEELQPEKQVPIFSASLSVSSIEECDAVIPRLVDAVLDRRPAEDNAQRGVPFQKEAVPYSKRSGETHLSFGLVVPTFQGSNQSGSPFGLSIELFYELEHLNLGLEGLFATHKGLTAGGVFFEGNWLPIDGEVSPYIGAGLGYMGADSAGGLGMKLQAGVEALRLHQIRVLAGFEVLVPFFATSQYTDSNRNLLPMFFLQFSL
jgi:hypothetical protein